MVRTIVITCLICLLSGGCVSNKPNKSATDNLPNEQDTKRIDKTDFLNDLILIEAKFKKQNQILNDTDIFELKNQLDRVCLKGLSFSNYYSIEGFREVERKLNDISPSLDKMMAKYAINQEQQDVYLFVAFIEIHFRLLTKSQEFFNEIFFNSKDHNISFQSVVSFFGELQKIHPDFMQKKEIFLETLITTLEVNSANVPKERIWIAIDRTLADIDFNSSGRGSYNMKNAPYVLPNLKPEELNARLKLLLEKENKNEIKMMAAKIITGFESRIVQ